jgi:ABC-type phosphate/phosphonate transport system permease subunit
MPYRRRFCHNWQIWRFSVGSITSVFLTVLGIVGFSGFGFELIAAIRLTANDQVAAILLTILACAVVLFSLGAILSRRLK